MIYQKERLNNNGLYWIQRTVSPGSWTIGVWMAEQSCFMHFFMRFPIPEHEVIALCFKEILKPDENGIIT